MYLDAIIAEKKREQEKVTNRRTNGCGLTILEASPRPPKDFLSAIDKSTISLIAEIKFKSPSKGLLINGTKPIDLARLYQRAGASAISIITENSHFGGSPEFVREVASDPTVSIPILFKDFIIDANQIYEARAAGADGVLLIARATGRVLLEECVSICQDLRMTPIVEVFSEDEIGWALDAGSKIIGINSRDLKTFKVNRAEAFRLKRLLPSHIFAVSESGIRTREDVEAAEKAGFKSMLVGEAIITSHDPEKTIHFLINQSRSVNTTSSDGWYGRYGGRYAAETLYQPLSEVEKAFREAIRDEEFIKGYQQYLETFVGRPTALTHLNRLSQKVGGAKIYAKREDLCHTGAHKINNALGQALIAKRLGKSRIVAETGAGQHGVAVATMCASLGLDCTIYMGSLDVERQAVNVLRMKLMGAEVISVSNGSKTLKDAVNEALRDWSGSYQTSHYLLGSVVGPHPYPMIVEHFQSVIGREARKQILDVEGELPDAIVACVGGGSNAIGIFSSFLSNLKISLYGVQAAGQGIKSGKHAAPLLGGHEGIFQGAKTYVLQDSHGQILETYSISAGLDYASTGPHHAALKDSGRVTYVGITDSEALQAFQCLSEYEGIIPALESSHAVAYAMKEARKRSRNEIVLVNLSGRGDKDLHTVMNVMKEKKNDFDQRRS